MSFNPTIRKAVAEDAEAIAEHLLLAMEQIIYEFTGIPDYHHALNFMKRFTGSTGNQYAYENCWVAEQDKMVVAAVNLYNGADLGLLRKPVIEYVRNHFNPHFAPEDETEAGEYYIDSLGVSPAHQGKGLGATLLRTLVQEYVVHRNKTLGLLVDGNNHAALRLYTKIGFSVAGTRMLLGKPLLHLQLGK